MVRRVERNRKKRKGKEKAYYRLLSSLLLFSFSSFSSFSFFFLCLLFLHRRDGIHIFPYHFLALQGFLSCLSALKLLLLLVKECLLAYPSHASVPTELFSANTKGFPIKKKRVENHTNCLPSLT